MQKISMMLFLILASCAMPTIGPLERCYVDLEYNECVCHQYQIKDPEAEVVSENTYHEVAYCQDLIGFHPDDWGSLVKWHVKVYNWAKKNFKKKR